MNKHINIPVFIPHLGCPHTCVFCNQKSITSTDCEMSPEVAKKIIEENLKTIKGKDVEIAFFGGSFTAIPETLQTEYLKVAHSYIENGAVSGIRASTRPDCINREILENLKKYGVKTIELGVQSMDNEVLLKTERGHTAEDVVKSAALIKEYGIKLGLQMMIGLPGDNTEKALLTADKLIALKPDLVRLYPTLVLKNTCLARMYEKGDYTPLTVSSAAELSALILEKFYRKDIPVIRVGLLQNDEMDFKKSLVAGPFHPAFREIAESIYYYNKICSLAGEKTRITLLINSRYASKIIGQNKANLEKFKNRFEDFNIIISNKVNTFEIQ